MAAGGGVKGQVDGGCGGGKMQFILDSVNAGGRGLRIGRVIWSSLKDGSPYSSLDTPFCLLYSRAGAIPNLSRDIEEEVLRHTSHVTRNGGNEGIMLTMPTVYMK